MAVRVPRQNALVADSNGRGGGSRTPSLRFWRPTLYQLSYTPKLSQSRLLREGLDNRSRGLCHIFFLTIPAAHRASPLPSFGKVLIRGGFKRSALYQSAAEPHFGNQQKAVAEAHRRSGCYSTILVTTPAPTVRPPSRMAKRCFSSIAIGVISSTSTATLSPGITISVPSGSVTTPVTSVVRK
jgi:hypothetical protein